MTLNFKQLTFIFVFVMGMNCSFAQLGFSHEIGIITGPVAFQSDFGVRNDFETNAGNTGIGIGIVHYINFAYRADCNCYSTDTYFNDHFKIRNEISWNRTRLDHFGKWVDDSRGSENAERLRRHSGIAKNFDIGTQIEYFPKSIRSFQAFSYSFAPYISLGAHFTSFNPEASTTYGDGNINNASNFYSYWEPGSINPEGGTTWSVVASIGTRYKLTPLSDLMIDLRWQHFFDNLVDGLDHQLDSNKANDWLVWLNFGYIYYLD
ncbi:glutamate dehydrogenase [uncultured Psychroserpens sp.]|uniref:THC0290_0291 family protein n=1 Tax=uncultured Psychroserpens sp. TaxID=255436 RepID=UPI002620205A|nr:glutamate dehydrogenase [uncultured Psychroserpens sp.]